VDNESLLRDLIGSELHSDEPMSRHTTLRVGGPARWFWAASDVEVLAQTLSACFKADIPYLFLGHGSNVLMSDRGYDGLIIQNRCKGVEVGPITSCESGASLGSLFHHTARAGYAGLEWGVGIPGTVGGALVSNAGAYRGNIGPLARSIRLVDEGVDQTVGAEWMEFEYRDSRLRRAGISRSVILSCTLELTYEGDPAAILARAKDYQSQRRSKQPYAPSAGSFFKNVLNRELAESLETLPPGMRAAGVVPAGYLIEACGLKGLTVGGAQASEKHANFLINTNHEATATDFFRLAALVKKSVKERFGVMLEEEVLYLGDWSELESGKQAGPAANPDMRLPV
jgi:UDP-N-acetylmuramate dehydrogenase